ncbi:hypothetical protein [Flavobacterium sp. GP15]|uniref:hypothetical protein n=1 Tax=Flavobacterium sp. GP15 TaxID=2758567 RepID=UPI00165DC33D|nr:hypothetical protein [Flavobacterium sp. GP15]
MNTTKKIVLKFDKREFAHAEAIFSEKIRAIEKIKLIAKTGFDLDIEVTNSNSLKSNVFTAIETKYKKQNTLNLTGEKLTELMQINLDPIFEAAKNFHGYDAVNLDNKPTKEQFTISVETDAEMERYNFALKLIDTLKEHMIFSNNHFSLGHYLNLFRNILILNLDINQLEPLPSFVKGN